MHTIKLPPKRSGQSEETWDSAKSLVVTGANGAGKSRFGVWIEDHNSSGDVHRISAQRALNLPDLVNPMPLESAQRSLHYGRYEAGWSESTYRQNKFSRRWGGQPFTRMLSDYELVVSALFADEVRRNRDYTVAAQTALPGTQPPECKLDTLQRIWSRIFPHRDLIIGQDRVSAKIPASGDEYAGNMMSDGERVAFYLLGQVLCAPTDAIVVIDEPEIHLHRAIQVALWDEAEKSRPDCTFVYITHDLEFAGARSAARKIWVKSFDGSSWTWDEVEPQEDLPDHLVFQVLGSRRPVLFVEGEANSLDQ